MKDYNVEPTVEAINKISETMRHYANQIERQAEYMQEDGDLSRASEVIDLVNAMMINARLDLLITRPLRETMK